MTITDREAPEIVILSRADQMPYEPGPVLTAALVLSPLALAIAAFWPASRGHWTAPVLATPALLLGLALIAALFNHASGPGVLVALIYAPLLLAIGIGALFRWRRRRALHSS